MSMYGQSNRSHAVGGKSRASRGAPRSKFFGKSSMSKPIGDPLITQRRIVKNTRYSDIKSTVRSGPSLSNTKAKVDRSNEIFKRIKRSALHNLMSDSESIFDWGNDLNSTAGFSEMSMMTATTTMSTVFDPETEFLLIDIREPEKYDEYHIEGAVNFSLVLMRRDAWTREVYEFKNRTGRIIVIYGETESTMALTAATLMAEKGFENSYLLTGGLKYFSQKFPGRIKPEVPQHLRPKSRNAKPNRHSNNASSSISLTAANLPRSPTKKMPLFNDGRKFTSPAKSNLSTVASSRYFPKKKPLSQTREHKIIEQRSPSTDRKGWKPE